MLLTERKWFKIIFLARKHNAVREANIYPFQYIAYLNIYEDKYEFYNNWHLSRLIDITMIKNFLYDNIMIMAFIGLNSYSMSFFVLFLPNFKKIGK